MQKKLPGKRNIKTAITVIFVIYTLKLINILIPTVEITGFYASIAAVFTIATTDQESKTKGFSRLYGTIIGGIIGIILYSIAIEFHNININVDYLFIFIGTIIIIHVCYILQIPQGIQGGMVLLIAAFTQVQDDYIIYAIVRTLETIYGVYIALFINKYTFKNQFMSEKK